ncbi:MAG: hypothetical protein CL678_02870 [Bdellovibrionaceae bacterium]|nr:hypothetical protein [Pseudobdellovibrionaceae bacterium]|tara:strand:- start:690 stop:1418 length:729 start_codon:yes stop_codon:yes gene_type:complete
MDVEIHKNVERGKVNLGWLQSAHTFNFGSYFREDRQGFGMLRVLNDDHILPSQGFGTHPHKNMEIVTILLSGALEHRDNQGNHEVIRTNEVQLMSAGKGVTHSEFNPSEAEPSELLQIWVFPEKLEIQPRYDQKKFNEQDRKNQFQIVVSPLGTDDPGVKMNQQSYFSLIDLDQNHSVSYSKKIKSNGVYVFQIDGESLVEGNLIERRDGIGVTEKDEIFIDPKKKSKILIIEVPLASGVYL